ncbi:MAG TPA: mechanosensitive ion channel family protein [Ensifer sp.]|nr:mechanosensitive ion channel family protein [Ensifer sp.]
MTTKPASRFFAALLAIALAGAGLLSPALAQDAQPAPAPAPPATSPVVAAEPSPVEAARKQLSDAANTLKALTGQVGDRSNDDQELADLKLKVDALTKSILDVSVSFNPRLTQIRERLAALGDPPPAGTAEDPAVKAERDKLNAERAMINSVTGDAENLSISSRKLSNQITEDRRTLFTNTLLKKTDVTLDTLTEAASAFTEEKSDFLQSIGSWFRFIWTFKFYQLMSALFFSLLAALVIVTFSYRLLSPLVRRISGIEKPAYLSRLSVAFWSTILPTLALLVFDAISLFLLDNFNVLRADVAPIVGAFLGLLLAIFFVYRLTTAVLAPREPNWRLAHVTNGGARLLTVSIVALAVVISVDFFLSAVSKALGADVVLTVVKSYVTSIIAGAMLFAISFIKPIRPQDGSENGQAWPRVVRWPLAVAGLALIAAALLGYVGLARFAATQIVMAGAVVVTTFLGLLSGRAIIKPGAFGDTVFGRYCQRRFKLEELTLDQIGLVVGFAFYAIAIVIGVPLLLVQWGFQLQEIWTWVSQIFTEITIGKFHFSLIGLMAGVAFFFVGLWVTRWLQGWLDGNVLARSKLDSGVRNSVKTGFGYVGIAVAALFGISAAGIDLSSLALVAGALSLGIGFGLQNIVSNFVSGLILLVERPFKVGDWVITGTTEGFVRRISVRATEIETFQHLSIIVPNSELINASVGNWTHKNRLGRVEIAVGVGYESDPRRVMEILLEIARAQENVLKTPEPVVAFQGFGDSSLNFELRVHLADVLDGLKVRNDIRLTIFERFKEEGIEFPFPQRDLHLKIEDGVASILREAVTRRGHFEGNPEKVYTNMGGLGHRPEDDDGSHHGDDDGDGDGDSEGQSSGHGGGPQSN